MNPLKIALLVADFTMLVGIKIIQIDNIIEKQIEEEEKRFNYEKIK